ncbi:MAG: VWA domain-containing protein [Verrucomicrobiota bacterium]
MSDRLAAADHRQQKAKESKEKTKRLGMVGMIFIGVIIFHAVMVPVVGVIVLARFKKPPEAVFEIPPKPDVKIPPQTPEHKMNVQKHEAMTPKPTFTEKLISTRPTEFALPDLPQVDLDQMMPLDPSELISDQVSNMMGSSGIGRGMGSGLLGGGGTGDGMSFLGIKSEGKRIVLLFDVSGSVVNKANSSGLPMSKIKDETIKLIENLPIDARFGLIQFVRNYKPFNTQLLAATDGNKSAAADWVRTRWSESGTMPASGSGVVKKDPNGIESVLDAAFAMDPDVVFLISDGSFWRDPGNEKVPYDDVRDKIDDHQENSSFGKVPVHFIGFSMRKDERDDLRRILRRTGGEFREVGEDD